MASETRRPRGATPLDTDDTTGEAPDPRSRSVNSVLVDMDRAKRNREAGAAIMKQIRRRMEGEPEGWAHDILVEP